MTTAIARGAGDSLAASLAVWEVIGSSASPSQILMANGSEVKANIIGVNGSINKLLVSKLETPIGTYDRAQIRTSDVACIDIDGLPIRAFERALAAQQPK